MVTRLRAMFSAAVSILTLPIAVLAQAADEELGWSFSGELTFVSTSGNAESDTAGLGLTIKRVRAGDELSFAARGLRAESTTTTRIAVGTPDDFEIIESSATELTAENFHLRARYHRDVNRKLFWFAGAGFERNEFAGFTSRLSTAGGIGRQWLDSERTKLRTDAGLTFTVQDHVARVAGGTDSFFGLRLSYDYRRQLTETTTFTSVLTIDQNFDESDDRRADFENAFAVSINDLLSLKTGFHVLYDDLPSFAEAALFDAMGAELGIVLVELDENDTKLTVSLVLTR